MQNESSTSTPIPPQPEPPKPVEPSDFTLYKSSNTPRQPRPGTSPRLPCTVLLTPILAYIDPIPDDDLTPTSEDLRAMQATLTARTQNMAHTPARMRAVREAELKSKRERFPETRARIRFMDGTQLEKVFPSTNKIRSIYAFVRSCLQEEVKPIKFVLYEPPKRELKVSDLAVRDQTLLDLQLAPSCLLLVRFEDDSLNHVSVPAPLSAFVMSQAIDPPSLHPQPQPQPQAPPRQAPPPASTSADQAPGQKKVPKWFKLGPKK